MLRIAPKRQIIKSENFKLSTSESFLVGYELLDTINESLVRDFASPYLELVRLLKESSEIEHALMVQYLYASFSIKPKFQSLAGIAYPGSKTLLGVAIQEMKHLHSVNKFLIKLGVLPNLNRQDFPYEPDIYPFEFNLEPLSLKSSAKYVYTEASAQEIDPNEPANINELPFLNKLYSVIGTNAKINHLGSLYNTIITIAGEVESSKSLPFSIQTNINEMVWIKDQGEKQHFHFFKSVFCGTHNAFVGISNIWDLPTTDNNYPVIEIPINPSAFYGHTNQIQNETERQIAWLSNIHYWIILLLLHQSYIDSQNFSILYDLAKEHMLSPLQSLGYKLAQTKQGIPFDILSLGYNPGINAESNLNFIKLLLNEGGLIVERLAHDLPESFPNDIFTTSLHRLNNLLKIV